MKERQLHHIWKRRKIPPVGLQLSGGEPLVILHPGSLNFLSGPDFLNAQIRIGETRWVGHVELHLKSSDWYAHGHQEDPNYQNVILHVVWEHNREVFAANGLPIPTLQLRDYVPERFISAEDIVQTQLQHLFLKCEQDLGEVPSDLKKDWLKEQYLNKLRRKSRAIAALLAKYGNNWEQVFFLFLLKNFGLNHNSTAFLSLGQQLDFAVVQKIRPRADLLECLFLGMSGLLDKVAQPDAYTLWLRSEFAYLKRKFSLQPKRIPGPEFCRLRPSNFPTIRLSQLAVLMSAHPRLFGRLMGMHRREDIHDLLSVGASTYWDTHYILARMSKNRPKKLSPVFKDLLILNTIIPFQYHYSMVQGRGPQQCVEKLLRSLPPERNRIVERFRQSGMAARDAGESQALLYLHNTHCQKNRCLECRIGRYLLKGI